LWIFITQEKREEIQIQSTCRKPTIKQKGRPPQELKEDGDKRRERNS
jgi:hypothetical protein